MEDLSHHLLATRHRAEFLHFVQSVVGDAEAVIGPARATAIIRRARWGVVLACFSL